MPKGVCQPLGGGVKSRVNANPFSVQLMGGVGLARASVAEVDLENRR